MEKYLKPPFANPPDRLSRVLPFFSKDFMGIDGDQGQKRYPKELARRYLLKKERGIKEMAVQYCARFLQRK